MSALMDARYRAMAAYTPGEQPPLGQLIKLNTNESPFPPSPAAVRAISREAVEGLRRYSPIGITALDRAIADAFGLAPEQVIVGNGSDEILSFIFLAYGDHGVRFADVTYGFYEVWARLYGVLADIVPVADDFTIDLANYLKNDAMIVIANPNAPTGLALSRDAVERIVRANPNRPVVIDEAYVDFGGESAVPLVRKYKNLLVVNTFSKSRNLAGARLGFALGDKALIEDLNKIRYSINPYNVNALTQLIGAASIADEAYLRDCVSRIVDAREYTALSLKEIGFDVLDSRANFVFAAPPGGDGSAYCHALRERGILVRHFDRPRTRAYARISIGRIDEMERLIAATREVFS